jgi:signal transduction histidine kinase
LTMRLASRLLIPLVIIIVAVMAPYAYWALMQREAWAVQQTQNMADEEAHLVAMSLEMVDDPAELVRVVTAVNAASPLFQVAVYDSRGFLWAGPGFMRDNPLSPAQVHAIVRAGRTVGMTRRLKQTNLYSVVIPLKSARYAAFELARGLSGLEAARRQVRIRFILNTATLILVLSLVMAWLLKRRVTTPLASLLERFRLLSEGQRTSRSAALREARELEQLGNAFEDMADRLERSHSALVQQMSESLSLERQLRFSERMAMVGKLGASVAHEVAVPLNVIGARAQMLRSVERLTDRDSRNLNIIQDQVARIQALVSNLLDIARPRTPTIELIDLRDAVHHVVDLLNGDIERAGVDVALHMDDKLPVRVDRGQIEQVLINILTNAFRAMDSIEQKRRIRIQGLLQDTGLVGGNLVTLYIDDSGPGVPPAMDERIFEAFFTTRERSGGSGIGLAVARSLVEQQGGTLTSEKSAADFPGARFVLRLPAAEMNSNG